MARPKKTNLSPLVGAGRKRDADDFVGSSFYIPRKTNNRFNRALLTLKDAGYNLDRSDILSALVERFCAVIEGAGDGELEDALEAAVDTPAADLAGVSQLKRLLHAEIRKTEATREYWLELFDRRNDHEAKRILQDR